MFILLYDTFVEFLLLMLLAVPSSPKELTIRPESRPVRTHGPFVVNALFRCVAGAFRHMGLGATVRFLSRHTWAIDQYCITAPSNAHLQGRIVRW